ncbi:flagellar protein export ATPase FliI [Fusibacter sp. A1]|nr:flagellar protein export ATPase FliI [Fusibacter sp. A1]NPE21831.1 flagellar protein export ATPase FliI [Fusibacter sp. A1]RXV61403.1 flagellar protein export ATPase FliI [Fusibacter sp. A1]
MSDMLEKYIDALNKSTLVKFVGRVTKVIGLTIEANGPQVKIGEVCLIIPVVGEKPVVSEVVGFSHDKVLLMPLGDMVGVGPGCKVVATGYELNVKVGFGLLGRVIDGIGEPIDGMPTIGSGQTYTVNNQPPNPLVRQKIEDVMSLGIKAIDGLLTVGKGQRVGVFAGSGVGKSTLLGMIARNTRADINVIALIGERGREVREFIEHDLGKEGLERSVVIVATSDKPALVRVTGALLATAIAEYFRDQGKNVILMMDSLTRFSMAQREIGLAVGEPPVTRGYTPSVFAMLPKLLERAGNSDIGSITGLYTVLVDGDDMNEPIADAVRGILDGHIVLSRDLANKGHYPAIDILQSISRVMPNIISNDHLMASRVVKEWIATYRSSEDLINIGAYAKGSNPKIDLAIEKNEQINKFLMQLVEEKIDSDDTKKLLLSLVG